MGGGLRLTCASTAMKAVYGRLTLQKAPAQLNCTTSGDGVEVADDDLNVTRDETRSHERTAGVESRGDVLRSKLTRATRCLGGLRVSTL